MKIRYQHYQTISTPCPDTGLSKDFLSSHTNKLDFKASKRGMTSSKLEEQGTSKVWQKLSATKKLAKTIKN